MYSAVDVSMGRSSMNIQECKTWISHQMKDEEFEFHVVKGQKKWRLLARRRVRAEICIGQCDVRVCDIIAGPMNTCWPVGSPPDSASQSMRRSG